MKKTELNDIEPNPEKIFEMTFAFQTSRVLLAGVDLEVFTHIANGYDTAPDIAKVANADTRGMEILLNSLTGFNLLTKHDGRYGLTPIAEKFLVKGIPSYYGDIVQVEDLVWEDWRNLTKVVRTGKPFIQVDREEEGESFFEKLVTIIFPMSYPGAKAAAEMLGVGNTWKNLNILDVAAGSGAWSIAFAECDPDTRVVAQDWPNVINVTKKFVNKFGLEGRYNYLPGDLRKVDFGHNLYDLVILGHICHSEGAENTIKLISRAYDSLKDDGMLLIADMIPDDERCSAAFPLLFAVTMLISTAEGNTFTMREYREWLLNTGFHDIKTLDVPGPSPLIVARK